MVRSGRSEWITTSRAWPGGNRVLDEVNRPVGESEIAPPGWKLDAEIGKMLPSSPALQDGVQRIRGHEHRVAVVAEVHQCQQIRSAAFILP